MIQQQLHPARPAQLSRISFEHPAHDQITDLVRCAEETTHACIILPLPRINNPLVLGGIFFRSLDQPGMAARYCPFSTTEKSMRDVHGITFI